MTPIKEVHSSSNVGLAPQMPSNINVLLHIALIQGTLIEESSKKQKEAQEKGRAAKLIGSIVNAMQKGNTADIEKMKTEYEEIMKNLRTGNLNVHMELAGTKVNTMLNEVLELKKKFDEATQKAEQAATKYQEAVSNYNSLKRQLAAKERELGKYCWVPGYGAVLAIEVLVLKGKVSSASSKVSETKEYMTAQSAIALSIKDQMDQKQEVASSELSTLSGKLAKEASSEVASLQTVIDSALNAVDIITGGK